MLTPNGWSNVDVLLEPFCESNTSGFQWFTQLGRIAPLISKTGQWQSLRTYPVTAALTRYGGDGQGIARLESPRSLNILPAV